YAAANLEPFYTDDDAGRVGSVAANALLGEVYMTMAGYPLQDEEAYELAEETFASIIDQVEQRFSPDYADVFTLENENKYDIFSVQFASGNQGLGSSLPGYISGSGSNSTPFPEWAYPTFRQLGQDLRVDSVVINEMIKNQDKRVAATVDLGYWDSLDPDNRRWISRTILTKFLEK